MEEEKKIEEEVVEEKAEEVVEEKAEEVKEEKAEEAKEEKAEEKNGFDKFMDTPDFTEGMDAKDIENNKGNAIISYIWILFLVPLLTAKESKFAQFHANQGIVLAIFGTIGSLILWILSIIPAIGFIFAILGGLLDLGWLLLMFCGILNAVNGKAKELPLIGKIRILK